MDSFSKFGHQLSQVALPDAVTGAIANLPGTVTNLMLDEDDTEELADEQSLAGNHWNRHVWPVSKADEKAEDPEETRKGRLDAQKPTDGKAGNQEALPFEELWDHDDASFVNKVVCDCSIKVIGVDPKQSKFELRIKCKWRFRTANVMDATETKMRVPGIRAPALKVQVHESRVWKDLNKTKLSTKTIYWKGVSIYTVTGYERFEMQDFPFDRQLVSLDVFDFVWQDAPDSDEYDFGMHIVSIRCQTVSMCPEWATHTAIILPDNIRKPAIVQDSDLVLREETESEVINPPMYASRFTVKLRLARKPWYYIVQIFGLTVLVTLTSLLALLTPMDDVGSRLSLYSAGVLTLSAFKYTISDALPTVPYSTKLDRVLLTEMVCVIACALEAIFVYRYQADDVRGLLTFHEEHLNDEDVKPWIERCERILFCVLLVWFLFTSYHLAAVQMGLPFGFQYKTWAYILSHQDEQLDMDEIKKRKEERKQENHSWAQNDAQEAEFMHKAALEDLNKAIDRQISRLAGDDVPEELFADVQQRVHGLKMERERLEEAVVCGNTGENFPVTPMKQKKAPQGL